MGRSKKIPAYRLHKHLGQDEATDLDTRRSEEKENVLVHQAKLRRRKVAFVKGRLRLSGQELIDEAIKLHPEGFTKLKRAQTDPCLNTKKVTHQPSEVNHYQQTEVTAHLCSCDHKWVFLGTVLGHFGILWWPTMSTTSGG